MCGLNIKPLVFPGERARVFSKNIAMPTFLWYKYRSIDSFPMNPFQVKLQDFVIKTHRRSPFTQIYGFIYSSLSHIVARIVLTNKDAIGIYQDEKNKEDLVYGSSDIDLMIITKDTFRPCGTFRMIRFLNALRTLIPISVAHMVFTETEFSNAAKTGLNFFYLNPVPVCKKYGARPLPRSTPDRIYARWSFFIFDSFSDFYYSVNIFKTSSSIRHFCTSFMKFIKSLSLQDTCSSKYAFCQKTLTGKNVEDAPAREICKTYLDISGGKKVEFNTGVQNDCAKAFLAAMHSAQQRLTIDAAENKSALAIDLRISDLTYPPKNKSMVIDKIRPAVREFCTHHAHVLKSVLLSSAPCTDFGYMLYFIFRDNLPEPEYLNTLRDSTRYFPINPIFDTLGGSRVCFTQFHPKIIKSSGLAYLNTFHNPYSLPTEYYYLQKHGEILFGDNVIGDLTEPDKETLSKNILAFASQLPMHLRRKFLDNDCCGAKDRDAVFRLLSLIFCVVPSARLMLEHGIITTSVKETIAEYSNYYGEKAYWLEAGYENYINSIDPLKIRITELTFQSWYSSIEEVLSSLSLTVSRILRDPM